jgi:hypothetical protein
MYRALKRALKQALSSGGGIRDYVKLALPLIGTLVMTLCVLVPLHTQ